MKYRILIRTVNVNVTSHNWLKTGIQPWETEDKSEALQRYHDLLGSHSASDLTLLQVVPVNIEVTTNDPPAPSTDGSGETGEDEDKEEDEISLDQL